MNNRLQNIVNASESVINDTCQEINTSLDGLLVELINHRIITNTGLSFEELENEVNKIRSMVNEFKYS